MACSGRYAEAWQFSAFWCTGVIVNGIDAGGGIGLAYLTDLGVDFLETGVEPNVGMILYNLTTGLSGPVTAVTANTLTATGVLWATGQLYRIVLIDSLQRSAIEHYLDVAASDLHAALAASGACDCALASWAQGYLEKLNIIDAAAYYQCRCGQPVMTDEMRRGYLMWCNEQLALIRTGFSQGTFIIGHRSDSHESVEAVRRYADELNPDIASFFVLTPFPGTEVYEEAVLGGWIEDTNWAHYDMVHAIMPTEHLSRVEVQQELYDCYDSFFGSWPRRYKGITSGNPITRRTYEYLAKQALLMGLKSLVG